MAYSQKQWEEAEEYFEAGLSLADITKKTGITKSQISKRSNKYEWEKETIKKRLIAQAVEVAVGKETLKETALSIHNEIVHEKTRYLNLIYGNAERLAGKLTTMIEQIDTPSDALTIANANDKLAITLKVAERHAPKQDINLALQQNQQTTVAKDFNEYYD